MSPGHFVYGAKSMRSIGEDAHHVAIDKSQTSRDHYNKYFKKSYED